jgi:hypothetical protein
MDDLMRQALTGGHKLIWDEEDELFIVQAANGIYLSKGQTIQYAIEMAIDTLTLVEALSD